jgi:hypothetical protein
MKATILISILLFATTAFGQATTTPEKSSPVRKAIMNSLRVPVERDLKQKIVFVTDDFKILANWAFVSGRPTTPSGGAAESKRHGLGRLRGCVRQQLLWTVEKRWPEVESRRVRAGLH